MAVMKYSNFSTNLFSYSHYNSRFMVSLFHRKIFCIFGPATALLLLLSAVTLSVPLKERKNVFLTLIEPHILTSCICLSCILLRVSFYFKQAFIDRKQGFLLSPLAPEKEMRKKQNELASRDYWLNF